MIERKLNPVRGHAGNSLISQFHSLDLHAYALGSRHVLFRMIAPCLYGHETAGEA